MNEIAAVVVAGGRGERAGGSVPKQYREIARNPRHPPGAPEFAAESAISAIQPVIHPDDIGHFQRAAEGLDLLTPVFGGPTRQTSVLAGLDAHWNPAAPASCSSTMPPGHSCPPA